MVLNELSSRPRAGQEVSGAPVGGVSAPGKSRDETDAIAEVSDSPPAASTVDEAVVALRKTESMKKWALLSAA